jgi:hypothetical protein
MAIMFLNVRSVSRGRGASAVAKAAYIARERLADARTGKVPDYRHVSGLEHAEILLPATTESHAAEWARDRATLWNRAESSEPRANARVAREYTIALPHELTRDARHALAKDFAQSVADRYGTAVDLAIHGPTTRGDERNFHAHLLATTRELTADGFGQKAAIELDTHRRRARGLQHVAYELRELRRTWADLANDRLREANLEVRLEPRSRATIARERERLRYVGAEREPQRTVPQAVAAALANATRESAVAFPGPRESRPTLEVTQQRAAEQWRAYREARVDVLRTHRERSRDRGADAAIEL